MNELFAADPGAFLHPSDLRFALEKFGPEAGRYLGEYPSDWVLRVEQSVPAVSPVEQARISTCLRRAIERLKLIPNRSFPFDLRRSWEDNAFELLKPPNPCFDAVIIGHEGGHSAALTLDSLDLPPTAEEKIEGIPREFVRVCKTIALFSPEIVMVDPYVNPCKQNAVSVLRPLLQQIARGRCERVLICARYDSVIGTRQSTEEELREALRKLRADAQLPLACSLEYALFEDSQSASRMHARYLFSIKGGVRLDQGFQKLPSGRKVDVGPISPVLLHELIDIYVEGRHDMQEVLRLRL
ncbi:MAG: hypothetical protein IPP03_15605 [Dechloromonas sp.]|jgi:hypothetical protein|nr:hypothetical protein [Candidatus Dechloromonas phosphoritropha]MBP8788552.1 hypothetical protein [Azonexus sp.]MBP9229010.1 hypothetical protein [Azonexus sp.]